MDSLFSAETLVLLAGLTYVLGYLTINQVILRLLILLGTGFYIWYYAIAADEPLWTAIWTSLAIGASTLFGLIALLGRNTRFMIPAEHKDIYPKFYQMVPGDFRSLMKLSKRYRVDKEEKITTEGQNVDRLFFVISGGMKAEKQNITFDLPAGIFVGEIAFMTGHTSSATTVLNSGSEVLEWDIETLRKKSWRSSRFRLALEAVISRDLAAKVAQAIAVQKP
jgi:hypothetical protein